MHSEYVCMCNIVFVCLTVQHNSAILRELAHIHSTPTRIYKRIHKNSYNHIHTQNIYAHGLTKKFHVYTHAHIFIYTHRCTDMNTKTCIHYTHIHNTIQTYTTHIHTYIHTYVHTYIHTHRHTHARTHARMECYSCQNYRNVLCRNTATPQDNSVVRFIARACCAQFLTYRISIYTYLTTASLCCAQFLTYRISIYTYLTQPVLRAISDLPHIHLYISDHSLCCAQFLILPHIRRMSF